MTGDQALRWHDPAFLAEAGAWIESETRAAAVRITGAIEQPHAYAWSTVLRVPTDQGNLFFKATAPETVYEAALTAALVGWFPDCLPELVAVDRARGWMLMRDGGEMLRASIRPSKDVAPWRPVIARYAELQAAAAERVPELLSLGLPDWRLEHLPRLYTWLLENTDMLRLGRPDGLSPDDLHRLSGLAPRFAHICADLAACGIPESINHGDFHDGNVLVKDGRITFFDWGDACVTHPFVTLRTFFVSIEIALGLEDFSFTPEMRTLLGVYLETWRQYGSQAELTAAYRLSRPVATIVKALAWHQTVSRLAGPLREQYAYIVPELMREFMVYEGKVDVDL